MSPDMGLVPFQVDPKYVNRAVGIDIKPEEMCKTLERMMMPATWNEQAQRIDVKVPCTRSDVMHQCDIMEDIAIAYVADAMWAACIAEGTSSAFLKESLTVRAESS